MSKFSLYDEVSIKNTDEIARIAGIYPAVFTNTTYYFLEYFRGVNSTIGWFSEDELEKLNVES